MTEKKSNNASSSSMEMFRFLVKTISVMLVIILLGLFFIKNLFDESKQMKKFDLSGGMGKYTSLANTPLSENMLRIFFTMDGKTLTPENHELKMQLPLQERVRYIVNKIITGPQQGYLKPTIPPAAKIRGVYILKNQAIIDLSEDTVKNLKGGMSTETTAVYSLVNSIIVNCPDISIVKILVEGNSRDVFKNYIDIAEPLSENSAIAEW